MWDAAKKLGPSDPSVTMIDLDGSLTGEAGVTVISKGVNITADLDCSELPGWNLLACRQIFVRVSAMIWR